MNKNKIDGQDEIQTKPQSGAADETLLSAVNQLDVTPGEWFSSGIAVYSKTKRGEQYLAAMSPDSSKYDNNAKLMAAAPNMYEVLYYIYQQRKRMDIGLAERIRAALEKAAGKIID
ncbi:MAG: hypothetical protein OEV78_13090 [Spirochaetia bacterium]|nr:hypothetical protein [Spirochaetia bacterium]